MKKYYTVNHNGQEISFNHHEEVAEQIKNHFKGLLLYDWAENGKKVFKVGGTEISIANLLESWGSYPSNRTAKILFEQLADNVYHDIFSYSINELIEGKRTEIFFPDCDFSIIVKEGEV